MSTYDEIKAFQCKICKYKAAKKSDLKKHIEAVHEGIKKFKCNFCDYKAARNTNLRKHIESVHEGIKQFKCNICDHEFAKHSNLKKHIESVHEGIKPFKCNMCQYETAHKPHLKIHIKSIHEGIKGFKCTNCNYETATKSSLKRHITFIHEMKKNEINLLKSAGQRSYQEVSFQCVKLEPSTLKQSHTLETSDPLLIHEIKEENFEENEVRPIQDLATVYIKQEEFDASGFQNEQENEMFDIKEKFF